MKKFAVLSFMLPTMLFTVLIFISALLGYMGDEWLFQSLVWTLLVIYVLLFIPVWAVVMGCVAMVQAVSK